MPLANLSAASDLSPVKVSRDELYNSVAQCRSAIALLIWTSQEGPASDFLDGMCGTLELLHNRLGQIMDALDPCSNAIIVESPRQRSYVRN